MARHAGGLSRPRSRRSAVVPLQPYCFMRIEPEPGDDPLRSEEFDALVRALLPSVQARTPQLSALEALRESSLLAEAYMRETEWLTWGRPRI